MADETPAPTPAPQQPPKKCPACGHETGQAHDKNCIYRGIVTDAVAV